MRCDPSSGEGAAAARLAIRAALRRAGFRVRHSSRARPPSRGPATTRPAAGSIAPQSAGTGRCRAASVGRSRPQVVRKPPLAPGPRWRDGWDARPMEMTRDRRKPEALPGLAGIESAMATTSHACIAGRPAGRRAAVLERCGRSASGRRASRLPPDPPDEAAERARIEAELAELRRTQGPGRGPREGPRRGAQAPLGGEQGTPRRGQGEAAARRQERRAGVGPRTGRDDRPRSAPASAPGSRTRRAMSSADAPRPAGPAHRRRPGRADRHRAEGPALADLPPPRRHRGALPPLRDRQEDRRRALHLGPEAGPGPGPALGARQDPRAGSTPEPQAHGFVPGRSIVTNAAPHAGRAVVVQPRPEGLLPVDHLPPGQGALPRRWATASTSPRCWPCSAPSRPACRRSWTARPTTSPWASRVLPQGACTSPAHHQRAVPPARPPARRPGPTARLRLHPLRRRPDLLRRRTPRRSGGCCGASARSSRPRA